MSPQAATDRVSAAVVYERGAQRLHDAITAVCDPHASFADRVQAALRAALALLAADPDLARLLTVEPYLDDDDTFLRYQHWKKHYGALLRRAAAESPEASTNPPFVEPALIGGLRSQIAHRVLVGETNRLEDLLPGFTEFLLAYYRSGAPSGLTQVRNDPQGTRQPSSQRPGIRARR